MRGCAFCVCSRNYIDMGLAVYLSTLYLVRICAEIPLHSVGNAWIMIGRCRHFEWLLIAIYRPNFRRSELLFVCRLLFFISLFFLLDMTFSAAARCQVRRCFTSSYAKMCALEDSLIKSRRCNSKDLVAVVLLGKEVPLAHSSVGSPNLESNYSPSPEEKNTSRVF